jgi:hypothetical protein
MNKSNDILISEITVRLRKTSSGNPTVGTGILYYEKSLSDKVYVLTASHCLFDDGDSFQKPFDDLFLDIYNPESDKYISILYNQIDENFLFKDNGKDVAVLILDKEQIDKINPNIPKIEVVQERQSFSSFTVKGFPRATKGKEIDAIQAVWKQNMTETKRFQLQLNSDYTEHNIDGFSGAGVFIEADDEVYLLGIFTRFRSEEKGKVIYCQYIEAINELLKSNFLPPIFYSYLGNNGLIPPFFSMQVEKAVKNLGPRFNEKLNFETTIVDVFDCISKNETFYARITKIVDDWLTERSYRSQRDNQYLAEIETELDTLRKELKGWLLGLYHSVNEDVSILPFVERIKLFKKKVTDKRNELYVLRIDNEESKPKKTNLFDKELNRLGEIEKVNYQFINDIDDLNVKLANHPTLIIKGEAGCGKSHLLGDIASQRKNHNLPTLLLLGQHFNKTETVEKNILSQLGFGCSFKELMVNINDIGLQINSRVLILIDAINEGAGADLWKHQIAGFIHEVEKYPAIGLVLTIRSTYYHDIIPSHLKSEPNISIITHEGFKGNEYEALKLFCEYYDLKLPNIPILNPEFRNPLFLHLICEAVKDLPDKSFPKGFNGISKIYSLYKQSLNKRFEEKRKEYKLRNIVSKATEIIAVACFNSEYGQLPVEEGLILFDKEFPNYPDLLSDLIEESVLIKYRTEYREPPEDVLFFSYQKLGDFFMAEELLKSYSQKEEVIKAFSTDVRFKKVLGRHQWTYRGITEIFSILLPEKYDMEIFEVVDFFIDKDEDKKTRRYDKIETYNWFTRLVLDSLKWREVSNIGDEKITKWLEKHGRYFEYSEWFYTLNELTTIPNHPFNSDRFHGILMRQPMPKRDGFLQEYIRGYSTYDDSGVAFPIRRLIDWAWSPNISNNADSETVRLASQTLSWILSSTDIALRDQVTKALVNLLEQQPDALIFILKTFDEVDDLYIKERLYAVAYGCILRTEHDLSVKKIAEFTYKSIFKKGNPPIHILLRDYARNIVEYALYKNVGLNINPDLIRPPYNSEMPILPQSEDDVKLFKLDFNSHDFKKENGFSQNKIYESLLGFIADFGHYIVQSAVDDFSSFSFKEDQNYDRFLRTLKKNESSLVKTLYKCMEQEKRFNKSYEYQKQFNIKWSEDQKSYLDMSASIKDMCKKGLNSILKQEQSDYINEVIVPYFERKLNKEEFNPYPVRYWIVKRVFELGYDRKIHGEYDSIASSHSFRSENKVERIGKKYQWIAFHEILAMLADNFKIRTGWSNEDKYDFYRGPWQLSIRNIDPSYVTKNQEDEEEKTVLRNREKKWWDDDEYNHWNFPDSEWSETLNDLISPQRVIQKLDDDNTEWIHLHHYIEWNEPKKIGKEKYDGRRKSIFYLIEGYLVKKTNKEKILNYLKSKNFWGRWMPEFSDDYSYLINREKFWSPAYIETYKERRKIWDTIRDTSHKVIVTTEAANGSIEADKSGAKGSYKIPCKYVFQGMNLQYAPIDGHLKNEKGETIVINNNPKGVLIKKTELTRFLDSKNLDIIWTVLGEKFSYTDNREEESFFKVPCGVFWLDENGKMQGELKMYNRD